MMSHQPMDQEEQVEISRVDEHEVSRVDEQQLTLMKLRSFQGERPLKTLQKTRQQEGFLQIACTDRRPRGRYSGNHRGNERKSMDQEEQADISRVHEWWLGMMGVVICLQAGPAELQKISQYRMQHVQAGISVIPGLQHVQVAYLAYLLPFYVYICSKILSSLWSRFAGTENYIISASVVMTAYGLLLLINKSYINILIVPIVILFFIAALWNKLWSKSQLKKNSANAPVKDGLHKNKVKEALVITAVPYCVLSLEAVFGDSLALSHFLWFLSSSLGAVAVTIALLPVAASPGGAQVLQFLYRTCIIVLTITVHTKAAELVMEDMALGCTPQLVTVLLWFTISFRPLGVSGLRKYVGLSRKIIVVVALLVLGYYIVSPAYEYQQRSRALRGCSISGFLTFFSTWMLRSWPGSKPVSQEPVKLLEFFAVSAAAVVAVMAAKCSYFVLPFWLVSAGQLILSIVYLVYLNDKLKQCARWLKLEAPVPTSTPSGKYKTQ